MKPADQARENIYHHLSALAPGKGINFGADYLQLAFGADPVPGFLAAYPGWKCYADGPRLYRVVRPAHLVRQPAAL